MTRYVATKPVSYDFIDITLVKKIIDFANCILSVNFKMMVI